MSKLGYILRDAANTAATHQHRHKRVRIPHVEGSREVSHSPGMETKVSTRLEFKIDSWVAQPEQLLAGASVITRLADKHARQMCLEVFRDISNALYDISTALYEGTLDEQGLQNALGDLVTYLHDGRTKFDPLGGQQ